MKRYIRSSNDDDLWAQTDLIDPEIGPAVVDFMELEAIDEYSWEVVKAALNEYWSDYEKFPNMSSIDSLDYKYSDDQRRFYKKYVDFAKKCRDFNKELKRVSGYGRMDAVKLELAKRLNTVDYNFPYGWKYT